MQHGFNLTINKQEAHPVMTNAFAIYTHNFALLDLVLLI
jgi:hypothetical protein